MFSLIIATACGVSVGLALYFTDVAGYGWSTFFGVLTLGGVQMGIGIFLQRKVKAEMKSVEQVITEGQKVLQAKMQRWQMRPPGSLQAMQNEIARDQRRFVEDALALTEPLHRFDR